IYARCWPAPPRERGWRCCPATRARPRTASGIHGQRLFVSPGLDLVVVHFGSQVISPTVPAVPLVQAFLRLGVHLDSQAGAATR
ncbi:hypothetical protein ACWEEL_40385, partial [Streptomyces sp. NPDC005009]